MQYVSLELSNGIAWITIDRKKKMNALNTGVLDELETCFQDLRLQPEAQVIIITGAGEKSFVAGADISQFPDLTPAAAGDFSRRGQAVFSLIESSRIPVIAAVNGFALGGGCELALSCHLRYASDQAVFGQPEVKLGVIAGYGGTQRLPRLIGMGRALDLLLTGRMVKADEAFQLGLVNEVFPVVGFLERVAEQAKLILAQGAQAQAFTLQAVYGGAGKTLTDGLVEEAQAFQGVFKTEDRVEGARAFLERRKPEFKNR